MKKRPNNAERLPVAPVNPPLDVPSKTVSLEDAEINQLFLMRQKEADKLIALGGMFHDILVSANQKVGELNKLNEQKQAVMQNFKEKYKIIGKIRGVDFERKALILE